MCQANAGCDNSIPDILGRDLMEFVFDAELRELLIPFNYNNNTEMKKICLALLFL